MNDLVLCLEVRSFKVMSTVASHSPLNISETVRDRDSVAWTTNRKWPMGHHGHVAGDVT